MLHKFVPTKGLDKEENDDDLGYNHLLSMTLWTMTDVCVEKLKQENADLR